MDAKHDTSMTITDQAPVDGDRPRSIGRMMIGALLEAEAGKWSASGGDYLDRRFRPKVSARSPKKRMLGAMLGALGTCLGAALLASCSESDAETKAAAAPAQPEVSIRKIAERTVADRYEFTGHTSASHTIEVRARVGGYVVNVPYEEGVQVEAGTLLFEIDPRPYQAVHAEAQAEVAREEAASKLAHGELERAENLVLKNAIAVEELQRRRGNAETADAQLAAARARLEAAALDLEFTKVRAPVAGRVSRSLVRPGNLISGGSSNSSLLATLVVSSPLHALFQIDEPAYQELTAVLSSGGKLHAEVETGSDRVVSHGNLDYIAPLLDIRTGTAQARVILANSDNSLVPGLFARVRVTADTGESRILVPETAIGAMQDSRYVLVVDDQNQVSHRAIVLGERHGDERLIESGLKPGESIVIGGLQKIRPGMTVKPVELPIAAN